VPLPARFCPLPVAGERGGTSTVSVAELLITVPRGWLMRTRNARLAPRTFVKIQVAFVCPTRSHR